MNFMLNPHSPLRPILVIEDNDMDMDFCLQAFSENAVANPVIACRDGEEALQFMDAHPSSTDRQFPLLVLLDLRLPKIDGIEVLRHARQHPVWKQADRDPHRAPSLFCRNDGFLQTSCACSSPENRRAGT